MNREEIEQSWDLDAEGNLTVHPLTKIAYAPIEPGHLALRLEYVTSPEEAEQVRSKAARARAIQLRLTPMQLRDLATLLDRSADQIEQAMRRPQGKPN